MPVVIYNVVPWSYLSPSLLLRIMREVPGVIGVKQSAGDLKLLADLLLAAPAGELHLQRGGRAALSVVRARRATARSRRSSPPRPRACVELWDAVQRGDHARALDLHRRLLRAVERRGRRQPARLHQIRPDPPGLSGGQPRAPMPAASPAQQRAIGAALDGVTSARAAAE